MATRSLRKRKQGTSDGDESEETKEWTEANVKKLMQMLQTEGFDGNYQALTKTFKSHSDSSLRYFFTHLQATVDDEKKIISAAFDPWIAAARENNETQRLGGNIPLMMRLIAQFEDHPPPESCGGVDYCEIYQCIASLLQGHVPRQMKSESAKKLNELLGTFSQVLKKWEGDPMEEAMMSTIHLTVKQPPPDSQERNRMLKERRRDTWSEQEEAQKNSVLSAQLQDTKDFYCQRIGLNPFHLASKPVQNDTTTPLPPTSTPSTSSDSNLTKQ